jgi:hypothetical protein
VALGPIDGATYLAEVLSGGSKVIGSVNWQLNAISKEETKIGQQSANSVYGIKDSGTGKNFLWGLKDRQKDLNGVAAKMGIALAKSITSEFAKGSAMDVELARIAGEFGIRLAAEIKADNASAAARKKAAAAAAKAKAKLKHHAAGGPFEAGEYAIVGEDGPEVAFFGEAGVILNQQQLSQLPGRNLWGGVAVGSHSQMGQPARIGGGQGTGGIERKLDQLIAATRRVGSDVGGSINGTGRVAGHSAAWNGG